MNDNKKMRLFQLYFKMFYLNHVLLKLGLWGCVCDGSQIEATVLGTPYKTNDNAKYKNN